MTQFNHIISKMFLLLINIVQTQQNQRKSHVLTQHGVNTSKLLSYEHCAVYVIQSTEMTHTNLCYCVNAHLYIVAYATVEI